MLCLALAAILQSKSPLDEFHARRVALRQSLDDGVLLLKGRVEAYDPIVRFEQDPNFYYLTGFAEPGAALLLTPQDEILFLPSHNERAERYSGKRTSAEDPDAHTLRGFENVPADRINSNRSWTARSVSPFAASTRPGPKPTPASCVGAIPSAK